MNNNLTQEFIKDMLIYNQETGIFNWNNRMNNKVAGTIDHFSMYCNYVRIRIKGTRYFAHRLAYIYMTGKWPDDQVDHINGEGTDNRWLNLRQVNNRGNSLNRKVGSNNTSGYTGVKDLKSGLYKAYININKKTISLGIFHYIEDAIAARKKAEKKYGYTHNE